MRFDARQVKSFRVSRELGQLALQMQKRWQNRCHWLFMKRSEMFGRDKFSLDRRFGLPKNEALKLSVTKWLSAGQSARFGVALTTDFPGGGGPAWRCHPFRSPA